jgi:hypothetical protein
MGKGMVILVTLLYVGTAIDQALKKDWGTAIMFTGYAFANLGLLMVME